MSPVLLGVCSVFMRIVNTGDGGDSLMKAEIDLPGVITEIHDIDEGKMRKRDKIEIPPKSTVVLRPMGHHLMAYKMPGEAGEGYEFTLRLLFEKSGEKRLAVRVVK